MRARCSRRSRRASSISASRTMRRAGFRATTSPPRAKNAFLRPRSITRCPRASRVLLSTPGAGRSTSLEVRQAIASMFDFEWINAKLYGGLYRRSIGFFDGSDLSSVGRPANAAERELLKAFPGAVSEAAMEGDQRPPVSDGSGRDREIARKALVELSHAGFALRGGALVDASGASARFRDSGQEPRRGAAGACLRPFAGPHRHFRPRAAGR